VARSTALLVSGDPAWPLSLATAWAASGDEVTVVLLDTAVEAARAGHRLAPAVAAVVERDVRVLAEEQALRRRSLQPDRLVDGVKLATLDEVADLVADGASKAVWL
jgi:predicted peroxiredoxin